jgi:hypothetical protein
MSFFSINSLFRGDCLVDDELVHESTIHMQDMPSRQNNGPEFLLGGHDFNRGNLGMVH